MSVFETCDSSVSVPLSLKLAFFEMILRPPNIPLPRRGPPAWRLRPVSDLSHDHRVDSAQVALGRYVFLYAIPQLPGQFMELESKYDGEGDQHSYNHHSDCGWQLNSTKVHITITSADI